jgi:hypothetical protein
MKRSFAIGFVFILLATIPFDGAMAKERERDRDGGSTLPYVVGGIATLVSIW